MKKVVLSRIVYVFLLPVGSKVWYVFKENRTERWNRNCHKSDENNRIKLLFSACELLFQKNTWKSEKPDETKHSRFCGSCFFPRALLRYKKDHFDEQHSQLLYARIPSLYTCTAYLYTTELCLNGWNMLTPYTELQLLGGNTENTEIQLVICCSTVL